MQKLLPEHVLHNLLMIDLDMCDINQGMSEIVRLSEVLQKKTATCS